MLKFYLSPLVSPTLHKQAAAVLIQFYYSRNVSNFFKVHSVQFFSDQCLGGFLDFKQLSCMVCDLHFPSLILPSANSTSIKP